MINTFQKLKNMIKKSNVLNSEDIKYFTPNNATNYAGYGNCYYYKIGSKVHLHIGIKIETTETITIYSLPTTHRPNSPISAGGIGSSITNYSSSSVNSSGSISVHSDSGYALIDVEYDTLN